MVLFKLFQLTLHMTKVLFKEYDTEEKESRLN